MTTTVGSAGGGRVVHLAVSVGDEVAEGQLLLAVELMKMEQPVVAPRAGRVSAVLVAVGDELESGTAVVRIDTPAGPGPVAAATDAAADGPGERQDLAEVRARRALLADEARPEAVARRHGAGLRTARQNVDDLLDAGSFVELGGLVHAAQRQRRDGEELRRRTPADGQVTGTGTVGGVPVAVAAYDATVLAGTQGQGNHRKTDRLLDLAARRDLPVVLYAEGGGGRPGDTDTSGASWLDAQAFHLLARLAGRVPTVSVVAGYCFAGNAALAGTCDVLVAVRGANLAMAGPAMVEGGGLGRVEPTELGPVEDLAVDGIVDVLVDDEAGATDVARRFVDLTTRPVAPADEVVAPDPDELRRVVPEQRRRVHDVEALLAGLVDRGTLLELRRAGPPGMVTALARIGGHAVGLLANDPTHLGGAIDAAGADSATRHLRMCEERGLPVVVLVDTPGFMVGVEAERDGGVRRFAELFRAGARLTVPLVGVVVRRAYGLGAQAMLGGHLQVPDLTIGWPTSEFGPMGLEGAVRLGFRRELEAIEDPTERDAREAELVELAHANAAGLNVATYGEIDDVVDPADTRDLIVQTLEQRRTP